MLKQCWTYIFWRWVAPWWYPPIAGAALPNQINNAVPAGSDLPSSLDNRIRNLALAVEDIFGVADQTNISNALFGTTASGLVSVNFQSAGVAPATAGHLARNGASLNFHDGTTSRGLIFDTATQTLTNKTLTSPTVTSPNMSGGGQWTGGPVVGGNPTVDLGITPRQYVDEEIAAGAGFENISFTASVAGNALTLAIKDKDGNDHSASRPGWVTFRSTTASSGTLIRRKITAATSITVSSGSSLGLSANYDARIYGVLCDSSGTVVMGAYNPFGAVSGNLVGIDESVFYATTAEGGAGGADSAQTIYTASADLMPVRVVGFCELRNGSPAGTWSNAVSVNQTMGYGVPRTGQVMQSVVDYAVTGKSTTLVTPLDDTTPQQFSEQLNSLSVSITPRSVVNRLRLTHSSYYDVSASAVLTTCFFQDNNVNALYAAPLFFAGAAQEKHHFMQYEMQAGTTASTSFRTGFGVSTGTGYFNQSNGGTNRFNGVDVGFLRVEEIFT